MALELIVVLTEPPDEVEHVGVAPHPGRKASEVAQCFDRLLVLAEIANEPINTIGVRPVGLHGHGVESLLDHEPLGDLGPLLVELMRSVRGFTEEYEMSIADEFEQRIVIASTAVQLAQRGTNALYDSCVIHHAPLARLKARSSSS